MVNLSSLVAFTAMANEMRFMFTLMLALIAIVALALIAVGRAPKIASFAEGFTFESDKTQLLWLALLITTVVAGALALVIRALL